MMVLGYGVVPAPARPINRAVGIAIANAPERRHSLIVSNLGLTRNAKPVGTREEAERERVERLIIAAECNRGIGLGQRDFNAAAPCIGAGRRTGRTAGVSRLDGESLAFAVDYCAPHFGKLAAAAKSRRLCCCGAGARRFEVSLE